MRRIGAEGTANSVDPDQTDKATVRPRGYKTNHAQL